METPGFEKPAGLILDLSDVPSLQRLYKKAIEEKKESFMFKGTEVLTDYAKYVLEYASSFRKPRHV